MFGSESENDGIAHQLVEELFTEMDKRQEICYEISYSVSELCGLELKHMKNDDNETLMVPEQDEVIRGNSFVKCESANSLFDVLSAVKNLDYASRFVTLKIQDLDHSTCGFIRIIFLPENEQVMQSGPSITALSSLEKVFLQNPCIDETEAYADNTTLTDILTSTIGVSNNCIILSLSSHERHPQQIARLLRLGPAVQAHQNSLLKDAIVTEDDISDSVLIPGMLNFDDPSVSQLSLHASMINSSILKAHMGDEDQSKQAMSPERWTGQPVRDSLNDDSNIFINLGKHLYEDADATDVIVKDVQALQSWRFLGIAIAILSSLFSLSTVILHVYRQLGNMSADSSQCAPAEMAKNGNVMNLVHFEITRQIIRLVQDVDSLFTFRTPGNVKHVTIFLGLTCIVLASTVFFLLSMFSSIVSAIGRNLKPVENKPKKKCLAFSDGRMMSSENKKASRKSQNPYMKHPRIMSPIDTSKIFMSRYTGMVVTNDGLIAEVVRSARISTPSPSKCKGMNTVLFQ